MRVKDEYAERAMRELFYSCSGDRSIISGESGACGLAGFLAIMSEPGLAELREFLEINDKTRILFYNTEGATDIESFNRIVER
jgi:diaminopropionate ammonia-lyase